MPTTQLFVPALNNLWHQRQIQLLADGKDPDLSVGYVWCLTAMFVRGYWWEPRRSWWFQSPVMRTLVAMGVTIGVGSGLYTLAGKFLGW